MLNILYDVAVLGGGYRHEKARTGVFRVVERVAFELARDPSLRLRFCATEFPLSSREYLRSQAVLAPHPFQPSLTRVGFELAERMILAREKHPEQWTLLRAMRAAVGRVSRIKSSPIRPAELSGVQVYHSPFLPLPKVTRRAGIVRFLTVYDLIAIRHPELFETGVPHLVEKAIASITPDDFALCISEATRQDLLAYRTDLDPKRVLVTHLAAADHFRPDLAEDRWPALQRKYGIPVGNYALTLSTLEPRKNIAMVIRCFARLIAERRMGDMKLVLVGPRGWKMDGIFAELDQRPELRGRIFVTGFVANEDLAPIYSHATMFIYPSLYEGFGLPPLEAMQCGVPVIVSNTSSLPEVVGDAGLLVSPKEGDELAGAMVRLYEDANLRAALTRRGCERAAQFSWSRCAAATAAAYQMAVAGR